jgi:hypothetical protein
MPSNQPNLTRSSLSLDQQAFQELLSAAYTIQEHNDRRAQSRQDTLPEAKNSVLCSECGGLDTSEEGRCSRCEGEFRPGERLQRNWASMWLMSQEQGLWPERPNEVSIGAQEHVPAKGEERRARPHPVIQSASSGLLASPMVREIDSSKIVSPKIISPKIISPKNNESSDYSKVAPPLTPSLTKNDRGRQRPLEGDATPLDSSSAQNKWTQPGAESRNKRDLIRIREDSNRHDLDPTDAEGNDIPSEVWDPDATMSELASRQHSRQYSFDELSLAQQDFAELSADERSGNDDSCRVEAHIGAMIGPMNPALTEVTTDGVIDARDDLNVLDEAARDAQAPRSFFRRVGELRVILRFHRADIYLVAAICVAILALLWPAAASSHRPGLSAWDRALVALGIAEAPAPAIHIQGDPSIQVWVDPHSAIYYCPGEEQYGKTRDGRLTTQREAQMDRFEPSARSACE